MLAKIAKKHKIGLISNIDDKLLGQTRRHIPLDFDLVVTAQQVRSYKPDPAHFTECERRIGGKNGWVHVASSYYYDVEPCLKKKIPVIWVNRSKQQLEANQKKPDAEVHNLREAAKLRRRSLGRREPDARRSPALITASVSPVATDAPTAIGSSATVPGLVRGDLVLHLHRLDHGDQRSLLDGRALLDRDLQHGALDRRGERRRRRRRRRRPRARAPRRLAGRRGPPPARRR